MVPVSTGGEQGGSDARPDFHPRSLDIHRSFEQQIARGIPVPCGYIHRGPVERPTGSGHWLVVIGHTPTHLVVNDPWGEPDLVSGATLNAHGMGLRFSRQNFGRRWMVEPIGGGAYRYAHGKGWAVLVGGRKRR